MERKIIEISWGSLWRILFFVLLAAVIYVGGKVLLGLFLAIVLSSGIDAIVDFLEKRGVPRAPGVIFVFLLGVLSLAVLLYAVIPFILADLTAIISGRGQPLFGALGAVKDMSDLAAALGKISAQFFSGDVSPIGFFSSVLGSFALAVAVLVSAFYLSLNRDGVERFVRFVFPPAMREVTLRIYAHSRRKIGSWLKTQVILSVILGVTTWGALTFLGVKHAFLVGVLAAVFELVPFVGPILSGATAVIFAFTTSAALAAYTLVVFIAIQQLESHVLVPILTNRAVGIHPVIVIMSLLIGGEVGGILGILIAVPAAVVFQEVLEEWGLKREAAA